MTHCVSCDKNLNDLEATRRHAVTGEYLDLCTRCLKEVTDICDLKYTINPSNLGGASSDYLPSVEEVDILDNDYWREESL